MVQTEPIGGEMRHGGVPDWQPLLDLVGEETTGWFMWMFDAELADGRILNAYKHVDTRRYLHIAPEGKTYLYVGNHTSGCRCCGHSSWCSSAGSGASPRTSPA